MLSSRDKPFSQACENNKLAILPVLKRHLENSNTLLEVGSGTGQHAVYFAAKLAHLSWQTSDQLQYHDGIRQWISGASLPNVLEPLQLNVQSYPWSQKQYDAVFTANTLHIMSANYAEIFMKNVANALSEAGKFIAYGPFNYTGEYTSESNARFDIWLKQQNADSAIRDMQSLDHFAEMGGLRLIEDNEMPANNRLLVWQNLA
jgi:cyclopropane fatty-acyl-phospholipid synthase-like methyltransferase